MERRRVIAYWGGDFNVRYDKSMWSPTDRKNTMPYIILV